MPFSRPVIVAVISAALFFLLSVPIAWGDNWPGEWAVVLWATDLRGPALTKAMQLLTFLAAVDEIARFSGSRKLFWEQPRSLLPTKLLCWLSRSTVLPYSQRYWWPCIQFSSI